MAGLAVNRALRHRSRRSDTKGCDLADAAQGKKRIRRDPETTRTLILDVTERLMVEEGYAAVSSRRIAQEIGINAATIHYYYPTTDDVFIALHRRMTDRLQDELDRVLASPNPLQAYWQFQSGWGQTALGVEFLALSNHRKAVGATLAAATEQARTSYECTIERAVGALSVGGRPLPVGVATTIILAVGRLLANEERVGITHGHQEVREFMEWCLGRPGP